MNPEQRYNHVVPSEVITTNPTNSQGDNLTFIEKLNLTSKVVFDTALPVRRMYKPINHYPQRTRAEVRIIRTLGGISLHSAFVIVGIVYHDPYYLVAGVNALALALITPRYLMEPRRIKQLVPRFIRKR